MVKVTWLGHSTFLLRNEDVSILIDPFIQGNSGFPPEFHEVVEKVDYILLTHGHGDHLGDAIRLVKKSNSVMIANYEIGSYLFSKGYKRCEMINIGGSIEFDSFTVTMVNAVHSSSIADADGLIYGGEPGGFVVEIGGHIIYHAGDTDVFSDMKLIQDLYKPDIGLIPIGGRFTMSHITAAYACNEFLNLKTIIPMHFDTFPVLLNKPEEFKSLIKRGEVEILMHGQTVQYD